MKYKLLFFIIIILLLVYITLKEEEKEITLPSISPIPGFEFIPARLIKVIDGDTAYFKIKGRKKVKVRFLWVNTEETKKKDPLRNSIWGYKAFKYTLKKLKEAKRIFLETKFELDHFKRVLAVVWVDEQDLSYLLIYNGYSPYYTKYGCAPGERHFIYVKAEQSAIKEKKGLWSDEKRKIVYYRFILPKWRKGCKLFFNSNQSIIH